MTAILAILTAAVLMVIGWLRARRPQEQPRPVLVRKFVHAGHAWVRETGDGEVLVGIDDFAQNVLGTVEEVRLPRMLTSMRQGGKGWILRHGNRELPILCPVSGRVVAKNEMVLRNPSLINTSPYGDGWLLRIRPRKAASELNNMLTGKAVQLWQDGVRARLHQFFAGTPALMYQDGGELVRGLAEKCSDDEWNRLVGEFFTTTNSSL